MIFFQDYSADAAAGGKSPFYYIKLNKFLKIESSVYRYQ